MRPPPEQFSYREVRHVGVQPVGHLVEAFRLPVTEILCIVRTAVGSGIPGLQDISIGAVRAIVIHLEMIKEVLDVILPMLHAIRRCHGRIAVPVQPETHSVLVRILARGEHALGPECRVSDGRMRLIRRIAVPPSDINDDILEPQGCNVIDERIVLGLRGNPTALPLAGRGKGVPFHLRVTGVLPQGRGHRVIEQVLVQAVRHIIQVPLVRAKKRGRHLEGLAGGEIGLESSRRCPP